MSTGIGIHKISYGGNNPYIPPKVYCPYCNNPDCEADWVDVGIGLVQCGPYYCDNCKASEASYLDNRKLSEKEKETGWYEPDTPVSESANTLGGVLVDHKTAKSLYDMGYLDEQTD